MLIVAAIAGMQLVGNGDANVGNYLDTVSYTHLRAHETVLDLVCRLLLEKKNTTNNQSDIASSTPSTLENNDFIIETNVLT